MANINQYLQAIMEAVYGEDVRGSIHDAIEIINEVGEKTLTVGTAVTSQSSSIAGYFKDSVYINIQTDDIWKCDGTKWVLQGNVKGATGATGADGVSPAVTISTIAGGHSIKITDAAHPTGQTFNVMDGVGAVYGDGHTIYIA